MHSGCRFGRRFSRMVRTLPPLLALAALFAGGAARAQEVRIRGGDYGVVPGFGITLPIELEATEDVTAFSFGIAHDAGSLSLSGVRPSDDLVAAMGLPPGSDPAVESSFYVVDVSPGGGDGFVAAVILGGDGAQTLSLAAGAHHIFDAEYDANAAASGTTTVEVTDQLGQPPVGLVIDVNEGIPRSFAGSSVDVSFSVPFKRGDADGRGSFNITDGIAILFFLFRGGDAGDCPATMNIDGSAGSGDSEREDLADIQITDGILMLQYLFLDGDEPASPFPACGQPSAGLGPDMYCRRYEGCN